MTIKKFQGSTRDEAIDKAKEELGASVVIMNVKEKKPSGLFGFLKKSTFEVTAALEDDKEDSPARVSSEGVHFDAVAGEKGVVSKAEPPRKPAAPEPSMDDASLKSAFQAVNEVIRKNDGTVDRVRPTRPENEGPVYHSGEVLKAKPPERNREKRNVEDHGPVEVKRPEETEKQPEIINPEPQEPRGNRGFVRMLYDVLLSNEVEEQYVNQILKDLNRVIQSGGSLDYLLSNVYQKMIVMLGKPHEITLEEGKPHVVFLIGPTGVGKTTTIAKIASFFKLKKGKQVALLTTDTYRIAAAEQLRTYADILEIPCEVVMDGDDINSFIGKFSDKDLILVDTTGFSHRNTEQKDHLKNLLDSVSPETSREIYLVLSISTKFRDLKEIIDSYHSFTSFRLIFTKLDETDAYGNILNSRLYADSDLSYVTNGQKVPDDLSLIDTQKIVKKLLEGDKKWIRRQA